MSKNNAADIMENYNFHTMLIQRYTDGISHEESEWQLPFPHNCLNWIVGHIAANRSHVLEVVGAKHTWMEAVRDRYHQDTPPVTPENPGLDLGNLLAYITESDLLLASRLEEFPEPDLDQNFTNYRGEKTRRTHLTGFHWHEAYHIGQVEILRTFILDQRD
jgi:hypothetical protein